MLRPRPETLSYLLSTTSVGGGAPIARRVEVLGLDPGEAVVYVAEAEESTPKLAVPRLARIALAGPYAGQHVPLASWYAAEALQQLPDRVAGLLGGLEALPVAALAGFGLSTRVIQHRGLWQGGPAPVRKFTVQVQVGVLGEPQARLTLTTYQRPRVRIDGAWRVPRQPFALVRLAYVGQPEGVGGEAQAVLLVRRNLTGQFAALAA